MSSESHQMPPTTLRSHLGTAARSYARRAIEAYAEESYEDFVLFAATAIERALKAKLIGESLLLLTPERGFAKHAVPLLRSEGLVTRPPPSTRTIGALQARDRLLLLRSEFAEPLQGIDDLINARNGEVHLGVSDLSQPRRLLVVFARGITALLNIDPQTFWGDNYELVSTSLNKEAEAAARIVAEKLTRARNRFRQTIQNLSDDMREGLRALVENSRDQLVDNRYTLPIDCPECAWPARAEGDSELEVDVEVDEEGLPQHFSEYVIFTADSITCTSCGLHLGGPQELKGVLKEVSWVNTRATPADFVDEDDYDDDDPWYEDL